MGSAIAMRKSRACAKRLAVRRNVRGNGYTRSHTNLLIERRERFEYDDAIWEDPEGPAMPKQ